MSIHFIDELILDIYVKKELVCDVNFNNKDNLECYLKKLFKILKSKYDIRIEGFYEITVYLDKFYGVVLHLEKDDLDYYDYFKNQVDMRIITVDTNFMYLVDDIPRDILSKVKVYIDDNNIYLKIKDELTDLEMMKLLENSELIYDK